MPGPQRHVRHYHTPNAGSSSRVEASGSIAAGLRYVCAHGVRDDRLLNQCHETVFQPTDAAVTGGHILATEAMAFAQVLVKVTNARLVLQADGRSGYGSLGLARALGSSGQLTVVETDATVAQRTRLALEKHSLSCKVEVVAVAGDRTESQTIRDLPPVQYDIVSLTAAAADATSRNALFEAGLALLRPGGLMLLHDTLLPDDGTRDNTQMRQFHEKLRADEGRLVCLCMLAIGTQGLMAVVKSYHRPPPAVSRPHALCRSVVQENEGNGVDTAATAAAPACPHGDRCNFAHTAVELRAWRQASDRAAQSARGDKAMKPSDKRSGAPPGNNRQTSAVSKSHSQDAAGHATLLNLSLRQHPQLSALIDRTATLGKAAEYASPADTVALLQLLVWATGARQVLEVGVFTGVATLGMAVALAAASGQRDDSQEQQQWKRRVSLIGCELEPKWPSIGLGYWQAARVANLIEIKLGDAVKTLQKLQNDEHMDRQPQLQTEAVVGPAVAGIRVTTHDEKCEVGFSTPDGSGFELVALLQGRGWVRQQFVNGKPHWCQAPATECSDDSQQLTSKLSRASSSAKGAHNPRRYHLFWAGPDQDVPAGWRISRHCDRPQKCVAVSWSEAALPPKKATWFTKIGSEGNRTGGSCWYECALCLSGFANDTEQDTSQPPRGDERQPRTRARKQFDLIFIDANKAQYETYFEQALKLLRPGGLIVLDNTLWFGRVYSSSRSREDNSTKVLRRLNTAIFEDQRLAAICMLPTADGITLACKCER